MIYKSCSWRMAGIFKKNDIRGTYNTQINEEVAFKVGFLFGKTLNDGDKVVVVGDSRLSTPQIKKSICNGLIKAGCVVLDAGMGPTPLTYFLTKVHEEIKAGVMVTASHNPKEDNGIKICNGEGEAYHYDNLYKDIETQMGTVQFSSETDYSANIIDVSDLRKSYYKLLGSKFEIKNDLKIAVEFGNGATSDFGDLLSTKFSQLTFSRKDPNGNFPTLLPDPTKSITFEELKHISQEKPIDLGIAFDGDGDRVGFLTPKGVIISPDKIAMILADLLITKFGSVKVLIDVKVSNATAEYIRNRGGSVDLTQVGHSWVHENLINSSSDFAAELSGHYYFNKGYYGFDDGLFTAVMFINFVDDLISQGKDLDSVVNQLPQYASTPEFRVKMPNATQDAIINKLKSLIQSEQGKIVEIDGIRGEFDDGWFIVRKSGTEEALSYRIEGSSDAALQRLQIKVEAVINELN